MVVVQNDNDMLVAKSGTAVALDAPSPGLLKKSLIKAQITRMIKKRLH